MIRSQRHLVLIAAVATFLLAASILAFAPRSDAQRAPQTFLPCAKGYSDQWRYVVSPSRCLEFRGNHKVHIAELAMHNISWSSWGGRTARGEGEWVYCCMGGKRTGPAHLKAFGRVQACGHRIYTRLNVVTESATGPGSHYGFRLPVPCHRS